MYPKCPMDMMSQFAVNDKTETCQYNNINLDRLSFIFLFSRTV